MEILSQESVEITVNGANYTIDVICKSSGNGGNIIVEIVNSPVPKLPIYEIRNCTQSHECIKPEVLKNKNGNFIGLGILLEAGKCIEKCEGGGRLWETVTEEKWKEAIATKSSPEMLFMPYF